VESRRVVSIVFCDVVGSTALGERLDPEALRAVLTRYYRRAQAVVERHGGTVEKFIGDAVMAIFGLPRVHEDDAVRAVRAADELRRSFSHGDLVVRIGVNTGEVVSGVGQTLGSGDAFNVAARLEQAAGPGEVLIGETTHRLVCDAVRVEPVEPLVVKGKSAPLAAWRLLEVDATAAGFARRMDTPLVGRTSELLLLEQVYQRSMRERRCHLFTLLGAPGLGKSRLIAEFLQGPAGGATVLVGHCLSYGEDITFWPLAEMLRTVAGIDATDDRAIAREKLDALAAGAPDAAVITTPIAGAIGLAEAAVDADEVFLAVRALLQRLGVERPLVMVVEDVHWAEPVLLDLVEFLADWSRDTPILIVCSARPELLDTRPGWSGGKTNATSVLLQPLTEEECARLIDTQLNGSSVSDEQRRQILAAVEGNPLFVEQMLAMLADHPEDTRVSIPPTLQALLAARLDRLDGDQRVVVECASVEGRVFHRSAVAELAPEQTQHELTRLLRHLILRELIDSSPSSFAGEQAFRFQHQLIRDAAYASMTKRVRADRHQRFANWLDQRVGERVIEYEEIIGYHLEQACLLRADLDPIALSSPLAERAGRMLAVAGRRAADLHDQTSAPGLMTRALHLLPKATAERCMLLIDLTRALVELQAFDRAAITAAEATEIARSLGEPGVAAHAAIADQWVAVGQMDCYGVLGPSFETVIATLAELGDEVGLTKAFEVRFVARAFTMQYAAAAADVERAAMHAGRANQRRRRLDALAFSADPMVWGPMPVGEAIARGRQVVLEAEEDVRIRAIMLPALGALEAMRGRFSQAREYVRRGDAVLTELGSPLDVSYASSFLSLVEFLEGNFAAAEAVYRAAAEAALNESYRIVYRDNMAFAILAQGRLEEADELACLTEHADYPPGNPFGSTWRRIRARVLAARGRHEHAIRLAREAVDLMAATDALHDRAETELDLAIVLRTAGRHDEATAAAARAIHLWELKGNTVSAAHACAMFPP